VGQSEQLITVATCSYPAEAYLLQSKLDSEGIWSTVVDAETVTMNWLYSNAIGGVKLKVREEDAPQAKELLQTENDHLSDSLPSDEQDRCPNCSSTRVGFEKFNRKLAFLTWLLWVPLPFWRNKWVCRDCGHVWRETRTQKDPGAA
jgi:hypothetical protein